MHVVLDVVHPAHLLFFRNLALALQDRGDTVSVVARNKDVTVDLVAQSGFPYEVLSTASSGGRLAQAAELLRRDVGLVRHIRRTGADLVLTRNPGGVQAAWLCRIPGIFDTDDGSAVGVLYRAARPFATVITTPDSTSEDLGPRHRRYSGYKALAYLHPRWFTPDPGVRDDLGLAPGERLFVVRLVAMTAAHDKGEQGLTQEQRRTVIERLQAHGRVVLTGEGRATDGFEDLKLPLPAHRFHDVLAAADLVVGDSQTVSAEAALLGTPALRLSSWTGRLEYLEELEHRYGLLRSFTPTQFDAFMAALDEALDQPAAAPAPGLARLLEEKADVTAWYLDLVDTVVAGGRRRVAPQPRGTAS